MKMRQAAYDRLQELLNNVVRDTGLPFVKVARDWETAGLSSRRARWDLLWAIPQGARQSWFDDFAIYDYLDDTHIDTALRNITGITY